MTGRHPSRVAARAAALALLLTLVFGTSPALAARDRTPPTKPTNLRVTSKTAHNITLAWNPSTDNSGTFSYQVWVSYGFTHTVSATTPRDTTAPSPPVVSVVGVNPTEVSLAWTASTDDGPYLFYQVFVNGVPNVDARQNRFAVVHGLTPATTYQITVKARDLYGPPNVSAPSNVVTVTTAAVSAVDTAPPSSPVNLHGWDAGDGAREINLFWTESFDNQTPQASIAYEVYLNGVLDHTTGGGRAILYATQGGENTFTVIAVDAAGNRSAPGRTTVVSP